MDSKDTDVFGWGLEAGFAHGLCLSARHKFGGNVNAMEVSVVVGVFGV